MITSSWCVLVLFAAEKYLKGGLGTSLLRKCLAAGMCSDPFLIFLNGVEQKTNIVQDFIQQNFVMISTQALQYLDYPLDLVGQRRPQLHHGHIICKPHSSADFVNKGLLYLEARTCFSVHSGIQ